MLRSSFQRALFVFAIGAISTISFGQVLQSLDISCEGTKSNGGGVSFYQYEVRNISAIPVTLTDLRIGTEDMNLINYSNIVSPPGFNFLLAQDTALGTTVVKTQHGQIVPNAQWVRGTLGLVRWNNPQGFFLAPNATAIFGFDHPFAPEDVEWVANGMGGAIGIGMPQFPVAGGVGVFTNGPVHGPGYIPEPLSGSMVGFVLVTLLGSRSTRRS